MCACTSRKYYLENNMRQNFSSRDQQASKPAKVFEEKNLNKQQIQMETLMWNISKLYYWTSHYRWFDQSIKRHRNIYKCKYYNKKKHEIFNAQFKITYIYNQLHILGGIRINIK